MAYKVEYSAAAERDLKRLPKGLDQEVKDKAETLADNPRPPGCEHLTDSRPKSYRIRHGDYRIVYLVDDEAAKVEVIRVANRKDVYKKRK